MKYCSTHIAIVKYCFSVYSTDIFHVHIINKIIYPGTYCKQKNCWYGDKK